MNKLEQAARQALEALIKANHFHDYEDEITALREALDNSLKPRCFADYQPNHAIDRACASCAIADGCRTGEQPVSRQSLPNDGNLEPVALRDLHEELGQLRWMGGDEGWDNAINAVRDRLIELYTAEQQEPVAWGCRFQDGSIHDCICPESHAECEGDYTIPLYTATPQREWVEPSDAKLRDMHHIEEFGLFCDYDEFEQIARTVLKLAKELNGGQGQPNKADTILKFYNIVLGSVSREQALEEMEKLIKETRRAS